MAHPLDVTNTGAGVDGNDYSPMGSPPIRAASHRSTVPSRANLTLKVAATSWFVVAGLGQLMFVVYMFGFYGRTAMLGQLDAWNQIVPQAHVPGDGVHNIVVAMHVAFAALITVSGLLQLTTGVRRLLPRFHHWNGRVFLVSAFVMGLSGLIMLGSGTAVGDWPQQIALSINALLIMLCAVMVLRHALARRFSVHRRWALRLFLVVSGVWFFRIGLTFWIMVNHGPVGFDPDTFTGPALTTIALAQYLLPLAILELYFRAQASQTSSLRIATATGLGALTLLTAAGSVTASMMLWLPHL